MSRRVLALLLLASLAHAAPFPRVACYSQQRGGGFPLVKNSDGTLDSLVIRRLSRYDLVTLNIHPFSGPRVDALLYLRRCNPKTVVLADALLGDAWEYHTPRAFWTEVWDALAGLDSSQAWLYDTNGGIWFAGYRINLGNRSVGDMLQKLWVAHARDPRVFDGAFLDYASTDIAWTDGSGGRRLDYRRAGAASLAALDSARRVAVARLAGSLKRGVPACFRLVGNGTTPRSAQVGWDGQLYEGWPHFQGGAEKAIKAYIADGRPHSIVKVETWAAPGSREWHRAWRWALGCAALGEGYGYAGPDRDLYAYGGSQTYLDHYPDEASVAVRPGLWRSDADSTGTHSGWLGEPAAPAFKWQGVYRRDFQAGAVLVNPSADTVRCYMGVPYKKLWGRDRLVNSGAVVTVVRVPPLDAVFLIATPRQARER